MIKHMYWSSGTVPVIHVRFSRNLNFLYRFSKNTPNFIKIRPVGTDLLHADGRTHTMKLTAAFRNFANAPNNDSARTAQ